jgi:RND superfamily putative drug exporter
MIAALTVLPALLGVLGHRVNSLRIRRSAARSPATDSGGWYRLGHSVMRRPLLYAIPIVVLLVGLGSPFLKVVWGGVDATVLPATAAPRIVTEALNTHFPGNPTAPIEAIVAFRGPVGAAPPGATAVVGGQTAALADELSSIGHTLPWMALAVVIATFVLLFLAFGSLILPLEAIVANALSLAAMYGVVTWIFGAGHLSGLLGFTSNRHVLPVQHHVHQAAGRRHDRGSRPGRHPRPAAARAGHHAPARARELVGAGAVAPPLRPVRHPRGRRPRGRRRSGARTRAGPHLAHRR